MTNVSRENILPRWAEKFYFRGILPPPPRKGTLFTPYALTLVGGLIFGGRAAPSMYIMSSTPKMMKWTEWEKMGICPFFALLCPFCPSPPPNDEMDRMGMGIHGQKWGCPPYFQKISS